MPDTTDAHSRQPPAADAGGGSGCAVFLIDESTAMDARVAGGTKSKAASIATALNSLLSQLTAGPAIDVAIVGYRASGRGEQDVGPRWDGPLAGRPFVSSVELAGAEWTIEDRVRKVPCAGGVGVAREETVRFPVWYVPRLGGAGSVTAAFDFCRQMLAGRSPAAGREAKSPMIVSLIGEEEAGQLPGGFAASVREWDVPGGPPLVLHAHLSSSDRIPATLYPSSEAHLPPGPVRALFDTAGILPEALCAELRRLPATVNAGARGLIYNARMADLIRFLSLVKTYAEHRPLEPATVEAQPAETPETVVSMSSASAAPAASDVATQTALIAFVLDRSVADTSAVDEDNVWRRLQDQANSLLGQVAARSRATIHTAVFSYGRGETPEEVVVEDELAGAPAGRSVLCCTELADAALRTEEVREQVSNGIGGLVEVTRKKPIFVDRTPTAPASPVAAFGAVRDLIEAWRKGHPAAGVLPVVLHLTRGRFEPDQIEQAVSRLGEIGDVALYHLVLTESPHPSLAYVAERDAIRSEELARLWELTSPLLGSDALAARRAAVSPRSRGVVVNGKFDLLLESVEEALTKAQGNASKAREE